MTTHGMPARHYQRYTVEELSYLEYTAGHYAPHWMARELRRTVRGVVGRYKRAGGSLTRATIPCGDMSTSDCARALGVPPMRVHRWIHAGLLHASRRVIIRDVRLVITADDLAAFLHNGGALLDGLTPADDWGAIVARAAADLHQRYIMTRDVADTFCVARAAFTWAATRHLAFPAPVFRLQGRQWYERAAVRDWLRTAPTHYRTPRALRTFGLEET